MKAGLILNVFALAVRALGFSPPPTSISSRYRGGMHRQRRARLPAARLPRRCRADPEPSSGVLTIAQVGVMWFQVKVTGHPLHVYKADAGSNAIESAFRLIQARAGEEGERRKRTTSTSTAIITR